MKDAAAATRRREHKDEVQGLNGSINVYPRLLRVVLIMWMNLMEASCSKVNPRKWAILNLDIAQRKINGFSSSTVVENRLWKLRDEEDEKGIVDTEMDFTVGEQGFSTKPSSVHIHHAAGWAKEKAF